MAIEFRTPLCLQLGIEHPIFSVGFASGARAELGAAVSNAGGFGVLEASGMQPEAIRAEIERTQTLTDRPFGVNVIIAEWPRYATGMLTPGFEGGVELCADVGGRVVQRRQRREAGGRDRPGRTIPPRRPRARPRSV